MPASPSQHRDGDGPEVAPETATPTRPRWTYVLPYLGRVPALSRRQWRILGLLTAAEFFDHYDMGILGLALLQIQRGLGIAEADLAGVAAVVRLGVIPAVAWTLLADRLGRRRLLLATILGFSVCTFGTAFVGDARQFRLLQFLARMFIYAETMLAVVVLAEELGARNRGWGIGVLGAMGALGHGLSAIVFGSVSLLPYGWRFLYVVGAVPLLGLAWFRRGLPETQRFEQHRAARRDHGGWRDWLRPFVLLMRMYPRRMAVLCGAVFPLEFVTITGITFMAKTLQEVHGYAPGQVTILFVVGGMVGILGNIVAGAWSDRFGRRIVVSVLIALGALGLFVFYRLSGWVIIPAWITLVFSLMGASVLFKTMGGELFPTSYRATASGVRQVVGVLGGVWGLALEGTLYQLTGSHSAAISMMIPVMLIPPFVVFAFLPETATRELEDIAPER